MYVLDKHIGMTNVKKIYAMNDRRFGENSLSFRDRYILWCNYWLCVVIRRGPVIWQGKKKPLLVGLGKFSETCRIHFHFDRN